MRSLTLKQRIDFALPLLLLWASTIGCAAHDGETFELSSDVARPKRSVVIFFVDGMDRGRLDKMLAAGMLPNISQHFASGGVEVKNAIASLPSLTYPNTVSLITGVFPGHHGILGNQWFDRSSLKYQDYARASTYRSANYDFDRPTLFEIMRDTFTVSVQCHTRRGATYTIDNWAMTGIDWFFGGYLEIDRRVGGEISQVIELAHRMRRWPTVLLLYFPGVDMTGHQSGAASRQYEAAVRNMDAQIGHVFHALHEARVDEATYFVLLSDHGHTVHVPGNVFDVVRWLKEQRGLHIFHKRIDFEHNPDTFAVLHRFDAVVVNGSYRRVVIHLKGPLGWASPARKADILRVIEGEAPNEDGRNGMPETPSKPTSHRLKTGATGGESSSATGVDPSQSLYAQPGVSLVCMRDGPNRVKVFSRAGSCIVERRIKPGTSEPTVAPVSNRCKPRSRQYRLLYPPAVAPQDTTKPDPLGYLKAKALATFVAQGWHGSRAWLAATAASGFPDFVPQVVEMFDSRRAGDIVVFAANDWTFSPLEPSGHGSCTAADMRVPLYFTGPGLPAGGKIDHARLIDVMPTILDLLGEAARLDNTSPIDGISLAAELKAAMQTTAPSP